MAQTKKAATKTAPDTTEQETVPPGDDQAQEASAATDDLLDEIDGVLEENAEEFVRSYVQKGGQ
jgi:ubiquitin-like protein Pup